MACCAHVAPLSKKLFHHVAYIPAHLRLNLNFGGLDKPLLDFLKGSFLKSTQTNMGSLQIDIFQKEVLEYVLRCPKVLKDPWALWFDDWLTMCRWTPHILTSQPMYDRFKPGLKWWEIDNLSIDTCHLTFMFRASATINPLYLKWECFCALLSK